jgi:hypothetical protein
MIRLNETKVHELITKRLEEQHKREIEKLIKDKNILLETFIYFEEIINDALNVFRQVGESLKIFSDQQENEFKNLTTENIRFGNKKFFYEDIIKLLEDYKCGSFEVDGLEEVCNDVFEKAAAQYQLYSKCECSQKINDILRKKMANTIVM